MASQTLITECVTFTCVQFNTRLRHIFINDVSIHEWLIRVRDYVSFTHFISVIVCVP